MVAEYYRDPGTGQFVPLPAGQGHTVQDEGVSLAQRSKLDFAGPNVTVTDDASGDKTLITVSDEMLVTHGGPPPTDPKITAWVDLDAPGPDTEYLLKAGGTMTGDIVLKGDPTAVLHPATKQYVDSLALRTRTTATYTSPSLAAGAYQTGAVALAPGYRLLTMTTSRPARVRLYTTAAKRDADVARSTASQPPENSGLVLDYVTTTTVLIDLTPVVDGFDGKAVPDGSIPLTVTNMDTAAGTVQIDLKWVRTE
jgi:hypothetical protein